MSDLVTLTIARLAGTSPLKLVAGLLSLNALVAPPAGKLPAAFVIPASKAYGVNGLLNAVRQEGPESVRVVLLIASVKPQATDAFNPVAPVEDAVRTRLLGWQPEAADGAVLLRSAQLIDLQPAFFTYEMIFFRSHTVRA